MKSFWLKNSFKTLLNTRESLKFFSLKTLAKIPKRWGLYRPKQKLAVRAELAALTGNGRPASRPSNGHILTRWSYRSTARSTQTNREQSSLQRSTVRSTGPLCCQTCTSLCTSVDREIDRPWSGRPTRSTGKACQPVPGLHSYGIWK